MLFFFLLYLRWRLYLLGLGFYYFEKYLSLKQLARYIQNIYRNLRGVSAENVKHDIHAVELLLNHINFILLVEFDHFLALR